MSSFVKSKSSIWHNSLLAFLGATLLITLAFSVKNMDFLAIFLVLCTLALMFLPNFIQAKYQIHIPHIFSLVLALFAYATVFLGEINNFYYRFWWWDIVLHSVSAVGFGLLGLIILLILFDRHKVNASPLILAVFSASFAIGIGVLWEVFEFSMDTIFGLNMQKSGLRDTMTDLIVDCVGAFFASVVGYRYLKFRQKIMSKKSKNKDLGDSPFLARSIHEAIVKNME